jgi:GT2 family glycosyltransferase
VSIAAIIVNFNAGELLQQCVSALRRSTIHTSITIVDNASSDGSAENLRNLYGNQSGIEFLFNPSNLGFAAAVNAVASRVDADYLLILNPDCMLDPTALDHLQMALDNDNDAAMAGPAVYDGKGNIQRATARRFPTPWKSLMTASGLWRLGKWFPVFHGVEVNVRSLKTEIETVEAVSGACMLVRFSAFKTIGYMDEGYRMHCEDLDLMARLAEKGWHCLYVPKASCVHQQGQSSRSRPTWVHYQKHRGMVRFFRKFQAKTTSFPVRMLVYTGIWFRFVVLWPLVLLRR